MWMVADVTKTCNVIPSLEFKTCMTIKSKVFTVLSRFEFKTVIFDKFYIIFNWLCPILILLPVS